MTSSLNIRIIDYGLGNLFSVQKAMHFLGTNAILTDTPDDIEKADGIILPGVGAFGDGMGRLKCKGFIEPLKRFAAANKPLLGICLGMQFLFSRSEEFGMHDGLDIIHGNVVRFPQPNMNDEFIYKIPHVGWNVIFAPSHETSWSGTILDGIAEYEQMYFVHSFAAIPDEASSVLAYTKYGDCLVTAAVRQKNTYGCQFHPEKSRNGGLKILQNYINIVNRHSMLNAQESKDLKG